MSQVTSLSAGRMPACTSFTAASAAAARDGVAGLRHWALTLTVAMPSLPAYFRARSMIRSHAGPKRRWHDSASRHSSLTALSIASALDGLDVSTPIASGGRLVAAASIMRFGWSGASTSTTRRSTRGGRTLLHGSMGISSSSSAWSSTIFRLVKWSFSVLDASRLPSVRLHSLMCSAVRSFNRTWPMTSQHARILPALVRYVVGLTRVL